MSYSSNGSWGTDEITSHTPMNHNYTDLFYTAPRLAKEVRWPKPNHTFPMPKPKPAAEGFSGKWGAMEKVSGFENQSPMLTENMLIILLLVIVVIMCTVIYSTVKQTRETMKLMVTLIAMAAKK